MAFQIRKLSENLFVPKWESYELLEYDWCMVTLHSISWQQDCKLSREGFCISWAHVMLSFPQGFIGSCVIFHPLSKVYKCGRHQICKTGECSHRLLQIPWDGWPNVFAWTRYQELSCLRFYGTAFDFNSPFASLQWGHNASGHFQWQPDPMCLLLMSIVKPSKAL